MPRVIALEMPRVIALEMPRVIALVKYGYQGISVVIKIL